MRYNRDMTQSLFVRRLEELMLQSNEKGKIESITLYCRVANTAKLCTSLLKGGAVR